MKRISDPRNNPALLRALLRRALRVINDLEVCTDVYTGVNEARDRAHRLRKDVAALVGNGTVGRG